MNEKHIASLWLQLAWPENLSPASFIQLGYFPTVHGCSTGAQLSANSRQKGFFAPV